MAWKDKHAQEIFKSAEEVAVEEARRITADLLPIGPCDWQGCEGNGDKGKADKRKLLCLDYGINYFSGLFASIHISLMHFSRRASRQALHRLPR